MCLLCPSKVSDIASMQRVGFLAIVPALLHRFGADPNEALAASGLEPGALDDPNATIPFASMGRLLITVAERMACPHIGLLIGKQITTASLGVVGELMQTAPTIGVALQDFVKHQHRNAHGSIAYLLNAGEHTIFGYTVYQPRMDALPHIYDGAAAAAFNILGELRAPDAGPGAEILFARAQPLDPGPYEIFFDAPLHFNARQTGVRFPSAWLDLPVVWGRFGAASVARGERCFLLAGRRSRHPDPVTPGTPDRGVQRPTE